MTDRHADIRAALESGPTPGPWFAHSSQGFAVATVGIHRIAADAAPAADPASDIRYITACHPESIRALLAERDALEVATKEAAEVIVDRNAEIRRLREALLLARDRIESERRSGEIDLLLRDIDAALAQEQGGNP